MAAIYAIDRAGYWDTLAWKARNTSAARAYVMLTVIVVMLGFVFRFRQRAASRAPGGSA
jgi:heme/copper-type cytochrome/quinol oxidase subunit 2